MIPLATSDEEDQQVHTVEDDWATGFYMNKNVQPAKKLPHHLKDECSTKGKSPAIRRKRKNSSKNYSRKKKKKVSKEKSMEEQHPTKTLLEGR
jgi:hypothetical protein